LDVRWSQIGVQMSADQQADPAWHASRGDQYKALLEYAKHIATLSAGSILLIATMLDKVFAHPNARGYVLLAVTCFLAALAISAVGILTTAVMFPHSARRQLSAMELNLIAGSMVLTCAAFIAGIGAVTAFFWSNW